MLVDEYHDLGPEQYELIAAIAGPSLDRDERLGLFAVGDNDQNVYAFSGASVRFIRRFEQDYGAGVVFLTDNYRSTAHIVVASNTVIEPAAGRMKAGRSIRTDRLRRDDAAVPPCTGTPSSSVRLPRGGAVRPHALQFEPLSGVQK